MSSPALRLHPAQAVFAAAVALQALVLLDGYALDLASLTVDPTVVFVLVLLEVVALLIWLGRDTRLAAAGDLLQFAGFLLVVLVTLVYALAPSLPTLLPPTSSVDAANHLAYANTIFYTGRIFGDYPGGPALILATLARWAGTLPFRVEHPLAVGWLALTAGGVYNIAVMLLPARRVYKVVALVAPFALFVPWDYFPGMLVGAQYFFSQVAAQFFLVAFLAFLIEDGRNPHPVWRILMGMCIAAVSVSFQLWAVLPVALLGAALLAEWRRAGWQSALRTGVWVGAIPVVFWWAVVLWGARFIPSPARFQSPGAIGMPEWDSFGGPLLVLPALGVLLLVRSVRRNFAVLALACLIVLEMLVLGAFRLWFGMSAYWLVKSFYLLVFPLALCAMLPIAAATEWVLARPFIQRAATRDRPTLRVAASFAALVAAVLAGSAALFLVRPPPTIAPLSESDLQVAMWAKEHVSTRRVNYISRKSLVAQWLGVGLWGEQFPDDMLVDMAVLGPKTFEEWRDRVGWGDYLFISQDQPAIRSLAAASFTSNDATAALRVAYRVGDSELVQRIPPPSPNGGSVDAYFGNFLAVRFASAPPTAAAGTTVTVTTRVESLSQAPSHQVVWRLQLCDAQGNAVVETRRAPFDDQFPLQRWQPQVSLPQSFALDLPGDLAAGLYDLKLGLYYVGSGEPVPVVAYQGSDGAELWTLRQLKVPLPPVAGGELAALTRTDAVLGDNIGLEGYRTTAPAVLQPGDQFDLVLYWRARAAVREDYTVFVHLLDPSGALRAQQDSAPRGGTYPTFIWDKDEVVPDTYTLTVPTGAPPGEYRVAVGMYSRAVASAFPRLPVRDASGAPAGDEFALPLTVVVR